MARESWLVDGPATECGMARAEREEVPGLLDLHRSIVEGAAVASR